MELNALMYPGLHDFEGAVKLFQKDLGDEPTGILTVWQIHNLQKRAEMQKLGQLIFPDHRGMKETPAQTWGPAKWNKVRRGLVELLKSPEVGLHSASAVAERLGVAPSTLKKHCPEEYAALKKARAARLAGERKRGFAEKEAALHAAFEECLRKGLHPSKDLVFEGAGLSPALYMNLRYRQLFREIRRSGGLI